MKVTLFLPVRNEIEGCKAVMPKIKHEWVDEIIAIDANSTDGTADYLKSIGVKVFQQKSQGLCGTYWELLDYTKNDIIVAFSPDGNSVPELIPEVVQHAKAGKKMVIASRYFGDAKSEDDDIVTGFGNWMFTKMINLLYRANYTDSLVMFRAFHRSIIEDLEMDVRDLPVFEVQMAIRCAKAKFPVMDIAGDEPKRIGGIRKMSPLYNGASVLYMILKELFVWRPKKVVKASENLS